MDADGPLQLGVLAGTEADLKTHAALGNAVTQDDVDNCEQAGIDGSDLDGHDALLQKVIPVLFPQLELADAAILPAAVLEN
jgi:hypothetical protein